MAVDEARLEDVGSGPAPVTPGWFVVNAADAAWVRNEAFGGVHLPPGTAHTFVGTGDGPCVIFPTGARVEGDAIVYPRFPAWRAGRPDAWSEAPWG